MFRRTAVLVVALLASLPRVGAAEEPSSQWKYDNPFCQVVAAVVPIPDVVASIAAVGAETRYALDLYTPAGTTLGAHVTLISDTDAYDAAVPEGNLSGPPDDRRLDPLVVTLPGTDTINYFFVDSYSLDRGAAVTCPSYVFPVGGKLSSAPTGLRSIAAQHLQKIASPKCGKVYVEPGMRGDLTSPMGAYGGKPLTVVARAYIDSNGYSIKDEIVQSSGVDGMDRYMLGAVGVHQFRPAEFLCVP
ncbi:MAG TPA: hypothetical protein VKE42_00615, partial [Candidatus Cybelea sp.]|nr:hypothetical protein [Candidatus Cybelea sp.]